MSDVMAICETGVKDMQAVIQQRQTQLTLVDAIGNYRQIPFDFCFTYEVTTPCPFIVVSDPLKDVFRRPSCLL